MEPFAKGRHVVRPASDAEDLAAAQRLRHLAFLRGTGAPSRPEGREADSFDALCRHVLVEEARSGQLVCCFRLMVLRDGGEIRASHAARHYELSGLSAYRGRMAEVGRFCIHPAHRDPDILRLAWAAMTRLVDAEGVEMLFGCTSFRGTDADGYLDAFAMLQARHLGPAPWLPRVKAPDVVRFAGPPQRTPDARRALSTMPPLLRTYLAMGGWVGDHAVVDRELGTLHVFTGLEIRAIPEARARLLRGLAA
jgi:L-ornithine Nalpha-acyltransferase